MPNEANRLYFGDCLEVMREDVTDESVDLVYLDPPFNSKRLYNAFLGNAQWVAFTDTWQWHEAVDDFHEVASVVEIAPTMEGLRGILKDSPQMAYLSYMANRLRECWRVLKPTGSLYLHCDPTMSHYLKVLLDGLFEPKSFMNEIIWGYRTGGVSKRWWPKKHDVLLFYAKPDYQHTPLQEHLTYDKPFFGTDQADVYIRDVWADIKPVINVSSERIGYPTQKPVALLDRILKASSSENDLILDPFCGCGTTIHSAQALGRRWAGIDICVNACRIVEERLVENFNFSEIEMEFIGMPKTVDDAKTLASLDAFRFERWAASLVDGMEWNKRKTGDQGIDGHGRLAIGKGEFVDMVSQVKGGTTGPGDVREFKGSLQQAGAHIGFFTCFEEHVTTGMRDAAASAGRFMDTPVLQIYTVEDYFERRQPRVPRAA